MSNEEDFVDGEVVHKELRKDIISDILWRTKERKYIRVGDMEDTHIRNSSLFLMGMGYQKCVANSIVKIAWLKVFRM